MNNKKSKQEKVIKSVISRNGIQHLPAVSYIKDGKQYVCDGNRIFEFDTICNSVPIGTDQDMKKGKLEQALEFAENAMNNKHMELMVSKRSKLAAYIKAEKLRLKAHKSEFALYCRKWSNRVTYNFGEDLPSVDAEFLLDALDGIPDGKLYCTDIQTRGIELSPIIVLGEHGKAVLMPVRKNPYTADIATEI